MSKVNVGEHAPFYQTYIDLVTIDPQEMLYNHPKVILDFLSSKSDRLDYRYAEGKWSIREVLLHICDTETVFAYRMLRIARGDQTPLPGFDQDVFIESSDFSKVTMEQLIVHFKCTRDFTNSLVDTLTEEQLNRVGVASGQKVSAGSIVYMIAGHTQHHIDILIDRYK